MNYSLKWLKLQGKKKIQNSKIQNSTAVISYWNTITLIQLRVVYAFFQVNVGVIATQIC